LLRVNDQLEWPDAAIRRLWHSTGRIESNRSILAIQPFVQQGNCTPDLFWPLRVSSWRQVVCAPWCRCVVMHSPVPLLVRLTGVDTRHNMLGVDSPGHAPRYTRASVRTRSLQYEHESPSFRPKEREMVERTRINRAIRGTDTTPSPLDPRSIHRT
jgi:hypothetical protein